MALITKKKPAKAARLGHAKRQSMNPKEFWHSLQNLDMEDYGSWPLPVKVFVLLLLMLFIIALAYAVPVSSKIDEIEAAEAEKQSLMDTFREKESKARYLDEYKQQVTQMETEFDALLDQLPKDTRVSELVDGISATGVGSGIQFQDISIEPEVEKEFFIEQPIRIAALGDYHQFGNFVSGLAALPRIITMHDFEVVNPQPSFDNLPELNLVLNTKTYRSKEIIDEPASDDAQEAPNQE